MALKAQHFLFLKLLKARLTKSLRRLNSERNDDLALSILRPSERLMGPACFGSQVGAAQKHFLLFVSQLNVALKLATEHS